MQELALEAQVAGDAVDGVAADRKLDRLQMDADLVRPPRLEPHLEERARPDELLHLEPRDRVPRRLGVERAARTVAAVTADRRLDPPGSGTRRAQDEREVAPLDPSLANRVREPPVRLVGARDDEQPGRVAVEAVDEPRPLWVSTRRSEREQTVRERRVDRPVRRDARRGPQACRRRAGARPRTRRRARARPERAPVPPEARPRPPRRPRADGSSDAAARRRARRPQSRDVRRAHVSQPRGGPRRPRPAAAPRRRQERESGEVPTAALERSAATNERNRRPTPTTMNVSARLNAGQ